MNLKKKMFLLKVLIFSLYSTQHVLCYSCGKTVFTESTGVITSPNYPSTYSSGVYCVYNVVSPLARIHLKWNYLGIYDSMPQCTNDFVKISIGCGSKARVLSKFCNKFESFLPHDIISNDNCMRIEFRTRIPSQHIHSRFSGFSISYKSLGNSDVINPMNYPCSNSITDITSNHGLIYTPNWPSPYYNKISGTCRWRIQLRDGYNVKYIFMNVSTNSATSSSTCYNSADYLQIKYTDRYGVDRQYRFCKDLLPFYKYYNDYSSVEITFNINVYSKQMNSGILMGFVVFKDDEAHEKDDDDDDSFSVPVYVYLMIPAFFVGGCCLFGRKKLNQMFPSSNRRTASTGINQGNLTTDTTVIPAPPPGTAANQPPIPMSTFGASEVPPYAPPTYQEIIINSTSKQHPPPPFQQSVYLPNNNNVMVNAAYPSSPQTMPPPHQPMASAVYPPATTGHVKFSSVNQGFKP